MAAVPAAVQACASAGVLVCRSCHMVEQSSRNAVCNPSQVVLSGRLCTKKGAPELRIHTQSAFSTGSKSKSSRLRAAASTEFEILSSKGVSQGEAQPYLVPETVPSAGGGRSSGGNVPGGASPNTSGLPSEFENAARLAKESQQGDFSSPPINLDSSVDDLPSFPSTTNPPSYPDVLPPTGDQGPPDTSIDDLLDFTEGNVLSDKQFHKGDIGDVVKGVQDSFGGAVKAVEDGFKSIQDAATNSVDGVVNAARGTVDSARNSVQNAVDSVNASVTGAVKSVTGTYDKSLDDFRSNVGDVKGSAVGNAKELGSDLTSNITSNVVRFGTAAGEKLREVIIVVKSSTTYAVDEAGKLILQGYGFAKDSAPADVQSFLTTGEEKISQITGPVGSAVDQTLIVFADAEKAVGLDPNDPLVPFLLIAGGFLVVGVAYFNSRYGGYAGDLQPADAFDLLKSDGSAILIDIRPQETREVEGVPDFRRSFRSRLAAVDVVKVEPAIRGMLRNVSDVEALMTAAVVKNLKNVKGGSQVLVMDSTGGEAKQIARGLRKSGLKRAYVLEGGFQAWISAGLRYKDGAKKPSAFSILKEDAAEIVLENKITPIKAFAVLLGLAGAAYAAYEWETTLQYIGILGLITTLYVRVEGYETIEDAKADLRSLLKPFNKIGQTATWVAGFIEPKKLQLAMAPASSNVQGRVLQAAAKHGQNSPESDSVDDSEAAPVDESTQVQSGQEPVDGEDKIESSGEK